MTRLSLCVFLAIFFLITISSLCQAESQAHEQHHVGRHRAAMRAYSTRIKQILLEADQPRPQYHNLAAPVRRRRLADSIGGDAFGSIGIM